jgi:membrane-associated HD superfamily phosphohydrolase
MKSGQWIYLGFLLVVLAIALILIYLKRKKALKKKGEEEKHVFASKIELFSLILFIFAMFLLDVNANMISAYGPKVMVTFFGNIQVASTSMFWIGFLVGVASFITFTMISMHLRKGALKKLDSFLAIIGGIGLGIILSGGLLTFGQLDELKIQFFRWTIERATYYHIGIAIEALIVFYFALTK